MLETCIKEHKNCNKLIYMFLIKSVLDPGSTRKQDIKQQSNWKVKVCNW
jgi:hypothetical protein